MTFKTTSSLAELKSKIEANRYDFYTLPVLDITIKHRKPDLLKLSYNNDLPASMAATIIDAYKEAVGGTNMEEYMSSASDKITSDDNLVKDLSVKGYVLLQKLSVSHRFIDVPESDLEAQPVPLISWNDVPEEDAISFLMHLLQQAQKAKTVDGGEITSEEVSTFPEGKRGANRRPASKNG